MQNISNDDKSLFTQSVKGDQTNSQFLSRSETTQEIITNKPDFFESWALSIFLLILFILIIGTGFIRYPDIIEANAILTGDNAPKEIIAKQSGRLTQLLVQNNQIVEEGSIIGWIQSTADHKEVIELSEKITTAQQLLNDARPEKIAGLFGNHYDNLGELQTSYQSFMATWQEFDDYIINGFHNNRKIMLFDDIKALENIKERALIQKKLAMRDSELARRTFEMNESLYRDKVISQEEFRKAESFYTNKLGSVPQIESNIISSESQIREKRKEIDQMKHDVRQQQLTFEQAMHTLKSALKDWFNKFMIAAPASGNLIFVLPIQKNQFIQQGKLLAYVNSKESRNYVEVRLSQNNFGKVDTGMKVQLRFEAYPYQEIGFVSGTLDYISNVAVDSGFLGTVRLDNKLMTNQKKNIQFKNGLKARAMIITTDVSLLKRLYYNLIKSTTINK